MVITALKFLFGNSNRWIGNLIIIFLYESGSYLMILLLDYIPELLILCCEDSGFCYMPPERADVFVLAGN